MSLGLVLHSTSGPSPRLSALPGFMEWTSTSALSASLRTISAPSGFDKSTHRLCLLRFKDKNVDEWPEISGGVHRRVSSPPPGRSILMTSAPKSPRICVQKGPATFCVKSRTRTPFNSLSNIYPRLKQLIFLYLDRKSTRLNSSH